MYKYLFLFMLAGLAACSSPNQPEQGYSNKHIKLTSNKLTPELLWQFGRIGNTSLSPNKKEIAYTIAYTDISKNKSYNDIYLLNTETNVTKQITNTAISEQAITWHPTEDKILFLSSESGTVQLYSINNDGSNKSQISNINGGITNYLFSPDGNWLMYTKEVKMDKNIHDMYPDLPLANARIEDDLMYRHWDSWEDDDYSHIFICSVQNINKEETHIDILENERFDSPLMPFGGIEQISWTPNSKSLAYTCKKLAGKAYAFSTNSDIYLYNIEDKTTSNLTDGIMGYDINPTFSNDGKLMAWESMERNGYESDKNRLMVMNLTSKEVKYVTENFDQNVSHLKWADNSTIYFTSNYHGTDEIYKANISNNEIYKITEGMHNYYDVFPFDDKLFATMGSMNQPTELYKVDETNGSEENVSKINENILNQLELGNVESRWITTTDNKKMQTWVIYPPNFDPNKKYPTLLYCQGGPQSTISQFWSLRWNFQLMAANDYIIVAPNRRGLPGFGREWNEQISGDYGGQNMKDYLSAIDELAKEPFVDENRLGAIGASYGGFSVYWLAGNHNKRFKTFVSHCGIFNFDQMYATTEEMFFVNWDFKGAYWDKNNKVAANSYANSPHKFVDKWDTPILVIHGEKDFRIPYTQGMGAFNTALMKDIPARFLFFPEEGHWVLSPQNGILWHREFFRWLDSYLK